MIAAIAIAVAVWEVLVGASALFCLGMAVWTLANGIESWRYQRRRRRLRSLSIIRPAPTASRESAPWLIVKVRRG